MVKTGRFVKMEKRVICSQDDLEAEDDKNIEWGKFYIVLRSGIPLEGNTML